MKKIFCIIGGVEYDLFYSVKVQSEAYIIKGYILTNPSVHFHYISARDDIQDFEIMLMTHPKAPLTTELAIVKAINDKEQLSKIEKKKKRSP